MASEADVSAQKADPVAHPFGVVPPGGWAVPLAHPAVALVGPTASGKSDVAQLVARGLGGAVLSADSMQVYRGMDVGTGKLPAAKRVVEHYGIDVADPRRPYSAALFQRYGRGVVRRLDAEGRTCVVCGGTGFWVRAVVDGYEFPSGGQQDNPVRQRCNAYAEEHGAPALWRLLDERDHASAALLAPNDEKRVARAFELLEQGSSYARVHAGLSSIPQAMPCAFFGLKVDPAVLRRRIDARVDHMFADGLVDEVRRLLEAGVAPGSTAFAAIGYRQVAQALAGERTMESAAQEMKTATHRYAKRQRTWLRRDRRIVWLDADSGDAQELAGACLDALGRMGVRTTERGSSRRW